MEAVACEHYKRSAPEGGGILACTIGHAKKDAISKSREIARIAYLDLIKNIRSGSAQKL